MALKVPIFLLGELSTKMVELDMYLQHLVQRRYVL